MPVPNVYTATEDPTAQVGNDGDIYFHTGLIGLSAINVYKKVAGPWGSTGSIATRSGSGAFLSANIARVDPSGNDGTGTVGDLNKPFLTVQSAIDAFELSPPASGISAVILIPEELAPESVTTVLPILTLVGTHVPNTQVANNPTLDITNTNIESSPVSLQVVNYSVGNITMSGSDSTRALVIQNGNAASVYISGGELDVTGFSQLAHSIDPKNLIVGEINTDSNVFIENIYLLQLTATSGAVELDPTLSLVGNITATGDATIDVYPADSHVIGTLTGSVTVHPSSDVWFNPAKFNFSTLPQQTDDSGLTIGQGWIDTTAGLNIVKVKL